MSLSVDNNEQELTLRSRQLDYQPALAEFTLGADADGKHGADFMLLSHICINRILSIEEKFNHYQSECVKHVDTGLHFKKAQFMRREPSGNLIQEVEENRPWYRTREKVLREWA
jgi:hypothetical protein